MKDNNTQYDISVFGAGSWGTALAIHLAKMHAKVCLWGRNKQQLGTMVERRENADYLPNVSLPANLTLTSELKQACQSEHFLIAVPSHAFVGFLEQVAHLLPSNSKLVIATKGLNPLSNQLLSNDIARLLPGHVSAILSGPSFAKEVAHGLPTAVTIASQQLDMANCGRKLFHGESFRVYTSQDVVGVQLAGAVKNVLAIAAGISDGLGFGANARVALITRGLAEMSRLGGALGAQHKTFMGLSGMGDLILTCTDNQSRNRRFGLALGQGMSVDAAQESIGQVVEGRHNARQVYLLAKEQSVEMPISQQVMNILAGDETPQDAVHALLSRPPTIED